MGPIRTKRIPVWQSGESIISVPNLLLKRTYAGQPWVKNSITSALMIAIIGGNLRSMGRVVAN
jgi:hypothetical protein